MPVKTMRIITADIVFDPDQEVHHGALQEEVLNYLSLRFQVQSVEVTGVYTRSIPEVKSAPAEAPHTDGS